jgi:hypothetical protein
VAIAAAGLGVLAGTVFAAAGGFSDQANVWPYAPVGTSPVLAAVGDIACQPAAAPGENEKASDRCSTSRWQAQTATADQIEAIQPNLVALLGDEQYQVGRYEDFMGSFDHTYGAFKFLQRPTPGNHEFYDRNKGGFGETGVQGYGYFDYYNGYQVDPNTGNPMTTSFTFNPTFGGTGTLTQPTPRADGQAGHFDTSSGVADGWYSYDLGSWHIIALNAECDIPANGLCDPNSTWYKSQTDWLAQDLSTDHAQCTLAYWHQPTFSAATPSSSAPGADPEGPTADAWWKLLYAHGADVILNGHDHLYARFAPMDPSGAADPKKGIREFIVGTGGESLDTLNPNAPNLEAGTGSYYGVMKLTLNHDSYAWDFESAPNPPAPNPGSGTFSDTGSARCHGPAGDGS